MIEIDVYGNQTHQSGEEPFLLIATGSYRAIRLMEYFIIVTINRFM